MREKLDLSQQQFGEALGFREAGAKMRVSEIERGDIPISRHVEVLCQYIGKFGVLDLGKLRTARGSRDEKLVCSK